MAKPSDSRKITFRMTRKHEHIMELMKRVYKKTTAELLNEAIRNFMQECINECKYAFDYDTAFAKKTDPVLNEFYTSKRVLISFRMTKENEELLYNHFKYFNENGEVSTLCREDVTRVVAHIVYNFLDKQDFSKLCETVGVSEDMVWSWIQKEYKALY